MPGYVYRGKKPDVSQPTARQVSSRINTKVANRARKHFFSEFREEYAKLREVTKRDYFGVTYDSVNDESILKNIIFITLSRKHRDRWLKILDETREAVYKENNYVPNRTQKRESVHESFIDYLIRRVNEDGSENEDVTYN